MDIKPHDFGPRGESGGVSTGDLGDDLFILSGGHVQNHYYLTLNNAALVTPFPELAKGTTKIWYMKPEHMRALGFGGLTWAKKEGTVVTKKTVREETHVLLGEINCVDLEEIFIMLQGENWSPRGEARTLIESLGLSHTSMSVGDVVEIGDQMFMVGNYCWDKIEEE